MIEHFLILAILFQVKHLIADYYLQFSYMYENKGKDKGWVEPLLDHTIIHTMGTLIIVFGYFVVQDIPNKLGPEMAVVWTLGLMLFDFATHFITDRWKATQKTDPSQSWFWQSLGIDQMIHHLVGIIIVYITITL